MSGTPMGRIVGKWPGDETEEQITEALEQSGKCQKCQKLEDQLRWRDVNVEPLPKEGSFLIVEKNRHYPKGVLMEFHWVWPFVPPSKNITHWMPMLKLPGGE